MKYSTILDRLQNLTNNTPSVGEMAKITGLDSKNVYARRKHDREFSEEEIQKIEEFYGISLLSTVSNDILLDYYPEVYASCGNGAEPFSTRCEKMSVSKALIKGYDIKKRYNVINTTSDSMEPEIMARDFLVIETEPEVIKDNHIYVFTYENEIYCKYLAKNLKEIIIRSANSLYKDVFLEGDEREKLKVLGEVVAVVRDYTR